MKKLVTIACSAALALALAGCASSGATSASAASASGDASGSASAASTASASASASASSQAEIPNPWTTVTSTQAAAEGAGVGSFEVGDLGLEGLDAFEPEFSYMDGIAQAFYESVDFDITIRKSLTASGKELSGDYNDYDATWTVPVDGVEVTCVGNQQGEAAGFSWSKDGANYAVMLRGSCCSDMTTKDGQTAQIVSAIS